MMDKADWAKFAEDFEALSQEPELMSTWRHACEILGAGCREMEKRLEATEHAAEEGK